ncbi:MAG: hypothetical protein FWG67_06530 [Defluviitaleaceae bacterium]|nr:hypothetical protein [Defluviitaleaceae bacterium]
MLQTILTPAVILLIIGLCFGLILGIADKFLKVEIDERMEKLIELLPGYNCGACGSPGCAGHAEAIFSYSSKIRACKPMKDEQEVAVRAYLETAKGPDGRVLDLKKL